MKHSPIRRRARRLVILTPSVRAQIFEHEYDRLHAYVYSRREDLCEHCGKNYRDRSERHDRHCVEA
jgi:hypothetical protein